MKTRVLANDDVILRFGRSEHLAVSQSLYYLLTQVQDSAIEDLVGIDAARAYQFGYSVHLAEVAAGDAGVSWLSAVPIEATGTLAAITAADIEFTEFGSDWRISYDELRLVQACATLVAHRVAS